jgi:ElaB/YqjD/DUF883 family membrane-anchored ribosome-binding protein
MAEEHHTNKGPAGSSQGGGRGEQTTRQQQTGSGSSGSEANLQSSGTSRRMKSVKRAASESGQIWDDATASIRTLKENTDEYVRQNPTKAVLTALAIGFVLSVLRRH